MVALLDIRPHRFKIDLSRPVRAVHAPQPALTLTFPEQEHADRVLLDQRGKRLDRAHDRQAPYPAAFLTKLDVTIENAALVEAIGSDGRDGSNDRNYGTGLHDRSAWKNTGQQDLKLTCWPAHTSQWLCRVCGGASRRSAEVHPCPAAVTLTSSSVVRRGAVATSSARIAVTKATIS